MPAGFVVEQRLELDEYEIERVVVRWFWGEGRWAEVLYDDSLLEGLRWAWMFSANDETIAEAMVARDGLPLFRRTPGPRYDVPQGDLQNLTLEEWRTWRQEQLGRGTMAAGGAFAREPISGWSVAATRDS